MSTQNQPGHTNPQTKKPKSYVWQTIGILLLIVLIGFALWKWLASDSNSETTIQETEQVILTPEPEEIIFTPAPAPTPEPEVEVIPTPEEIAPEPEVTPDEEVIVEKEEVADSDTKTDSKVGKDDKKKIVKIKKSQLKHLTDDLVPDGWTLVILPR